MALKVSANHDIQTRFRVSFTPQDCRPQVEDVACYLGGAGYRPKPHILKRVDKALALAESVVAPAAALAIHPVRDTDAHGVILEGDRRIAVGKAACWHQAAYIAASVATLGPGLEETCRELSHTEPFAAIVLDAVGVAYLDKLGEKVARETRRQAQNRGLFCGVRFSPGLDQVDLRLQVQLFELVDVKALGVELNEDLVMKPFKSISECRAFTDRPQELAPENKCKRCDLMTCEFRRSDPIKRHPR